MDNPLIRHFSALLYALCPTSALTDYPFRLSPHALRPRVRGISMVYSMHYPLRSATPRLGKTFLKREKDREKMENGYTH
jgi:hypothetical protein